MGFCSARWKKAWGRVRASDAGLGEAGLGIVEIIVAFSLLAIIAAATASVLYNGLGTLASSRSDLAAANLATKALEEVSGQAFSAQAAMVTSPPSPTVQTVQGVQYTVATTAQWVPQAVTSGANCSAPPNSSELLRVKAVVTWPHMPIPPVVQVTTFPTPAGIYSPTDGNIGVEVLRADGSPAASIPVTATVGSGGTATTVATASNGCAFFAYMSPGPYTISLNQPGWVDPSGNSSPSQSATVSANSTVNVQFQYDQASSVTGQASSSAPMASGVSLTLNQSSLAPSYPTASFSSGGQATAGSLFPFQGGYTLYAGNCNYSSPNGEAGGQPIYSGATAGSPAVNAPIAAPAPGSSTTVTVPVGTLQISASDSLGLPVSGATVSATEIDPSPCPANAYTLSTTGLTGTSSSALPFGQYQVTVSGNGSTDIFDVWVTPGGDFQESAPSTYPPASPTFQSSFPVTL